MKNSFVLMATYNQWMNNKLYQAVEQLSDAELSKDRGAFFGSIIGTLNHILVGDIIWLQRFASHESTFTSLKPVQAMPTPASLNTLLFQDIGELSKQRAEVDQIIIAFIDETTEAEIAGVLRYKNTKGQQFSRNLGSLLQHFFNHQTHHRGQVSTLLSQSDIDIGVTDLLALIPEC